MSEEREKIGSDVLGGYGRPNIRMSEKKRKELEKKLKEELERKRREEEAKRKGEPEKLPKENIPGELPGELSPEQIAELEQRGVLTGKLLEEEEREKAEKLKKKGLVYVKEHARGYPSKKREEEE